MDGVLGRGHPTDAARRLLGAEVSHCGVTVRIVEVEAYGGSSDGPWPDPAAHSYRGPTPRNSVMFGPAGRLYVYLSYGIHLCMNVTCGPVGTAGAVLLRSGEVIDGVAEAARRRPAARAESLLASGPGNLGKVLGISLQHNGSGLFDSGASPSVRLHEMDAVVERGPRVGVSAAAERPWRLWLAGSPSVSAYRRSPRAPSVGGRSGSLALPSADAGGSTRE